MNDETQEQTGYDLILGGLSQFAGGVEARPAETHDVEHVVTSQPVSVPVLHINGEVPGEVASQTFWVNIKQLELAPRDDLLNSWYDPADDPDFQQYYTAVGKLGPRAPALVVLPANRDTIISGKTEHIYLVYGDPALYYSLIELKRARVRVEIAEAGNPGALLFEQITLKGAMHREPSILEICLAAKRLHEVYDFTLAEIAVQLAKNREEQAIQLAQPRNGEEVVAESQPKPKVVSTTYVHYLILVAGLAHPVHVLLHRKMLGWTQARTIAEYFEGDADLCIKLATLAGQGQRMTVEQLRTVCERIKGGVAHLEEEDGGLIKVALNPTMHLPPPEKHQGDGKQLDVIMSFPLTLTKTANVRREATRFRGTIVVNAGDTPDRTTIGPQSYDTLITWLSERRNARTSFPMRDIEAVLYGYIQAMNLEARRVGAILEPGTQPPMVDARRDAQEA